MSLVAMAGLLWEATKNLSNLPLTNNHYCDKVYIVMIKEVKEMQVFDENQMDIFNKIDLLQSVLIKNIKNFSPDERKRIAATKQYKFERLHPYPGYQDYSPQPANSLPDDVMTRLLSQGTVPVKRWKGGQVLGVIGYLSLVV